jgi:protein N-terminal amidase
MRIATLQFAPKLGDVEGNIRRANDLLQNGQRATPALALDTLKPDILVLPELALTGAWPHP